ncbi:hypothetical protein TNCV_1195771 [Trichonephila clavipes]|nr:hypothetical protein TNCV_1195771 [Trichonephila clavipes]
MVTSLLRYECIMRSFLIDECRITELFSGCIVNFVKHVRSTSSDMMLVDKDLYAVHRVQTLNPTGYLLRLPVGGTAMCSASELNSSGAEQL